MSAFLLRTGQMRAKFGIIIEISENDGPKTNFKLNWIANTNGVYVYHKQNIWCEQF